MNFTHLKIHFNSEDLALQSIIDKTILDTNTQGKTAKHEISLPKMHDKAKIEIQSKIKSVLTDIEIIDVNEDLIQLILKFKSKNLTGGTRGEEFREQIMSFNVSEVLSKDSKDVLKWIDKLTLDELLQAFTVQIFCPCESFKFHFSKIHKMPDNNSFYLGKYNNDDQSYTVQGVKPSPNPRRLGGMCKHLQSDAFYLEDFFPKVKAIIKRYVIKFLKTGGKTGVYNNMSPFKLKREIQIRGLRLPRNAKKIDLIAILRADDKNNNRPEDVELFDELNKAKKEKVQQELIEKSQGKDENDLETFFSKWSMPKMRMELRKRKIDFKNNATKSALIAMLIDSEMTGDVVEPNEVVQKDIQPTITNKATKQSTAPIEETPKEDPKDVPKDIETPKEEQPIDETPKAIQEPKVEPKQEAPIEEPEPQEDGTIEEVIENLPEETEPLVTTDDDDSKD